MMWKKILSWLKGKSSFILLEQKGQSLIIYAFAVLGLIAMLGLALDLGLVYIEQVRVSRTTDAATLAAVVELPFEEEAMERAIEYIELNGYKVGEDTEVRVRGCINRTTGLANVDVSGVMAPTNAVVLTNTNRMDGFTYIPSVSDPPRAVFIIDTLAYQPVDRDSGGAVTTTNQDNCTDAGSSILYGTANKVRVTGQVMVDMNFMQFFGFREVPVEDQAVAENVTSLDVMVVFDVSGSMDFETTCFDCWRRDTSKSVIQYPFPSNGNFFPLKYKGSSIFWGSGHDICEESPTSKVSTSGYHYLVHEAEFYSRDVPLHGWEFDKRTPGQGFWVLQRRDRGSNDAYIRTHVYPVYSQGDTTNYPQLQGAAYNSECFDGPDLSGKCWRERAAALGEPSPPSEVPWVEYDFTPDWTGNTHIWIRAQGGSSWYADKWNGASPSSLQDWTNAVYWQVDGNDVEGGQFSGLKDGGANTVNDNDWRWVKLGSAPTISGTQHTLKIYQGSAGFNLDKIIFTNYGQGVDGTTTIGRQSGWPGQFICLSGCTGVENHFIDVLKPDNGEGPSATDGSATREACNKCNPAFGQTAVDSSDCSCKLDPLDTTVGLFEAGGTGIGCTSVTTTTNQLTNELYHDVDPLRSAKEAVKNFAMRLDPKFDQIGVVAFSTGMESARVKLQCLRYAGAGHAGVGGVAKCYDPSTNPISYTKVITALENYSPQSYTNIPQGMREGLEELGIGVPGYSDETQVDSACGSSTNKNGDGHACDRRGAARRILILLTDGSPNRDVSCPGTYNWRGQFGQGNRAYDCSMFFAQEAAKHNVTVYTIGIGSGVNIELLTAMATGTDPNPVAGDNGFYFEGKGGKYYPAVRPSDLDGIFEDILSQIVVRIVG